MSRHQEVRNNSQPGGVTFKRVIIQQTIVPSVSVASMNTHDSSRSSPKTTVHDASGRGNRGRQMSRHPRGVVARIVSDLDRGIVPDNVDRRKKEYAGKNERVLKIEKLVIKEDTDRLPIVPPKPKSKRPKEGDGNTWSAKDPELTSKPGVTNKETTPGESHLTFTQRSVDNHPSERTINAEVKSAAGVRHRERDKNPELISGIRAQQLQEARSSLKTRESGAEEVEARKKNNEKSLANENRSRQDEKQLWNEAMNELKEKLSQIKHSGSKGRRKMDDSQDTRDNDVTIESISSAYHKHDDKTLGGERELWEQAMKELQLTIADKELAIDNLSRVNRKLSEDIELYEGSSVDNRDSGINCDKDIEFYKQTIQDLETQMKRNIEGFERVVRQRDERIRELEEEFGKDDVRATNVLELSHGSQNVLKILGLRREKVELEKKVEQLEARLRYVIQERGMDHAADVGRTYRNIRSVLAEFEAGVERTFLDNTDAVDKMEQRLMQCQHNFETFRKLSTELRTQESVSGEAVGLPGSDEMIKRFEEELKRERIINDELMEKYIELEESNTEYLHSIKSLQSQVHDTESVRAENDALRERNEDLLNERLTSETERKEHDAGMNEYAIREMRELRKKRDECEDIIGELREKIAEDEELIEELRANCQREEKWNREMQRHYEWELSTSIKKDDRIEEFQDVLWAQEKTNRELRQQLEFEDQRYGELLEKIVGSQKEAEELRQMNEVLTARLDDSEKRIKEFCDQNEGDAISIRNLTSENRQLRLDSEGLRKVQRGLEEDLERVSESLEAVEADKENFLTKQKTQVSELSDALVDKEYKNKDKDEVIKQLQENVVLLTADVQEMEFKIHEGRLSFEEELKKYEGKVTDRDSRLQDLTTKYRELEEICASLRESVAEKEDDVLEREAIIAHQREKLERLDNEDLRRTWGCNEDQSRDEPALLYTEDDVAEIRRCFEEERSNNDALRKQLSKLEAELQETRTLLQESCADIERKEALLASSQQHEHLLIATKAELKSRNEDFQRTKEELLNTTQELANMREEFANAHERELSEIKDELVRKEQEIDAEKTALTLLQVDLTELNTKYQLLEAIKEHAENELRIAKQRLEYYETYNSRDSGGAITSSNIHSPIKVEDVNVYESAFEESLMENETEYTETPLKEEGANFYESAFEESLMENETEYTETPLKEEGANFYESEFEESFTENEVEYTETDGEKIIGHFNNDEALENMENEVKKIKAERDDALEKNKMLNVSAKEHEALLKTHMSKEKDLEAIVENLTEKWLSSEEKFRALHDTHLELRQELEDYTTQSQQQLRYFQSHKREVVTLTKYIEEMDGLVQGLKTSLVDIVKNGEQRKDESERSELEKNTEEIKDASTHNDVIEHGNHSNQECEIGVLGETRNESANKTVTAKSWKGKSNANNNSYIQRVIRFFGFGSEGEVTDDKLNSLDEDESVNVDACRSYRNEGIKFMRSSYEKIINVKLPKNVSLVLMFLVLVVSLGFTNDVIIPRKYLFVFANTFFTLIFFGLWANETHKNRLDKLRNGEKSDFAAIKSSFQELHERFLEAIEHSGNDALPIQELYEKYETLKDEIDSIKEERLQRDATPIAAVTKEDSVNTYLPERWNKALIITGKTLLLILLCEVLYIRGLYFLPNALNTALFLASVMACSYFHDTVNVECASRVEPDTTTREQELLHEIEELGKIIEKEHELVTTQREAIKVLEKRLRKEFEKRMGERNILLKKLKYRGKLESLRALLDNDEHNKDVESPEKQVESRVLANTDINSNINDLLTQMDTKPGIIRSRECVEGINSDTRSETLVDIDESKDGKATDLTQDEEGILYEKLERIVKRNESDSSHEGISQMLLLLGLPLVSILTCFGHITTAALSMAIQGALVLKHTNLIKIQTLPKILRGNPSPIIVDTGMVLYACVLALFLHCRPSTMVLMTCAIAELAVHWWTSYKLAKRDDILQDITWELTSRQQCHVRQSHDQDLK